MIFSLFGQKKEESGSVVNQELYPHKVEQSVELDGKVVSFQTGVMAKQARGSVVVSCGDTKVLVTVCAKSASAGTDFLPLVIDYREKKYAVGSIPTNYFRREARPADHEVLAMRLIDRPLRPMFPEGFYDEVQVMVSVISSDKENCPDTLAIVGASMALSISDIPFSEPIAGVRVGRVNGKLVINPTLSERDQSDIDVVMAGTKNGVIMVEGGGDFIAEAELLEALKFGHSSMKPLLEVQEEFREKVGKEKYVFEAKQMPEELLQAVKVLVEPIFKEAFFEIKGKLNRGKFVDSQLAKLKEDHFEALTEQYGEEALGWWSAIIYKLEKKLMRSYMLESGQRDDGRSSTEVRPITCEVGILPRSHGSALFTRGETQALVVTTLGTEDDAQSIDALETTKKSKFFLHYNFPPFSVCEVKPIRSVSRREVGHGHLAERSLKLILPQEDFPYTVRIVSDILESNGSSSMASVCGGSLSLFDAGVQTKGTVAGIAMGLIKEGDQYMILSDILGIEDHLGDMDFKVAGTKDGITGFQMDVKIKGISFDLVEKALAQAYEGRCHIIDIMEKCIDKPRKDFSALAPSISFITIPTDKIRDVIGQGGKVIKELTEKTGVKISIEDSGQVSLVASEGEKVAHAKQIITEIVEGPQVNSVYQGKITRVKDFGVFVEIIPGCEGLLHISEISEERIKTLENMFEVGQVIDVLLYEIDKMGRFNLSIKRMNRS